MRLRVSMTSSKEKVANLPAFHSGYHWAHVLRAFIKQEKNTNTYITQGHQIKLPLSEQTKTNKLNPAAAQHIKTNASHNGCVAGSHRANFLHELLPLKLVTLARLPALIYSKSLISNSHRAQNYKTLAPPKAARSSFCTANKQSKIS
jgi:hypothetical protein